MCLSTGGGGVVTQHALQVVSQHALQQVSGGGIPVCLAGFQAHTQGGSRGGSGQGGLQAHNQRGYMLQGGCRRYASYWNAFLLLFWIFNDIVKTKLAILEFLCFGQMWKTPTDRGRWQDEIFIVHRESLMRRGAGTHIRFCQNFTKTA